jgi:hypothetical protein
VLEELKYARFRATELESSDAAFDSQCVDYGLLPPTHVAELERGVVNQVVTALLQELVAETTVRAA